MGPYASSPHKDKDTHFGEGKKFMYCSSEMQGWRNTMEDACINVVDFTDEQSIFGVFDGHGGKEVAIFVKRYFLKQLLENKNYQDGKYGEALIQNFCKMDDMIRDKQNQKEIYTIRNNDSDENFAPTEELITSAGCTANVALFVGNKLYVANSGDARSVIHEAGKAIELSEDHKPDNPIEKDRITKAGGFVQYGRVNGNLNLSRAIGDLEFKSDTNLPVQDQIISCWPDIKTYTISEKNKFLLMGCDGIWEVKSNQELIQIVESKIDNVNKKEDLGDIVEKELLDELLAKDTTNGVGCDNMTTILIKIKHEKQK